MNNCPESKYRSKLSENEFWNYVFNGVIPGEEDDFDEYEIDLDIPKCKVCGSTEACGYDSEGRPMIHAEKDEEDE